MTRDNHAGKRDMCIWLAGFFDGEGYIGLRIAHILNRDTENYKCNIYQPVVTIVNTDKNAIDIIYNFLIENGLKPYLFARKQHLKNPTKWKPTYDIGLRGINQVYLFIKLVEEYSIIKKPQIKLLKKYIEYRLSGNSRKKYGKHEESVYQEMMRLKHI